MNRTSVDITIIIEFENLLLADQQRARTMLAMVKSQVSQLQTRACEVIAVHNPNDISGDFVQELLRETGLSATLLGADEHYYQLKNHGTEAANGEVVVFIDSDVVPNDVWLQEITRPFWQDNEIKAVAGASYLEPEGIVGKSFALGWFFPLKPEEALPLQSTGYFFANNIAFRRPTFLEYKFPTMPAGATRGACTELARNMVKSGEKIWKNNNAQVTHPAPNGLRHILIRALAEGRDSSANLRARGRSTAYQCTHLIERTYKKIRKAIKKIFRHRKSVQLQAWQVPVSISILTGYYLLSMIGGYLNIAFPETTSKWWMI